MTAHVCLVTPGHLATDPRLVKAADALSSHGLRVTVVRGRFVAWADDADREFDARAWQRTPAVPFGPLAGRATWLRQGITRRVAGIGERLRVPPRDAWHEHAFHPITGDLIRAACAVRADLYIGHNLAGLIAAGHAAARHDARLGFDAEDDHVGELPDDAAHAHERARREAIHQRWLPRCTLLTAAAPLMATQLERRYGVPFVPIHNVFALPPASAWRDDDVAAPLKLTWFSQTVGTGRGIEPLLALIAAMRAPAELHLRGLCDPSYRDALLARAAALGVDRSRLSFAPPVAPAALVDALAPASLGASVEIGDVDNRRACLGNKIFQYLAAGVPVLMSRTPAQDALAAQLGDAALSIDLADTAGAAAMLDAWCADASRRRRARDAARDAAHTRWHWGVESRVLVDAVERALAVAPMSRTATVVSR